MCLFGCCLVLNFWAQVKTNQRHYTEPWRANSSDEYGFFSGRIPKVFWAEEQLSVQKEIFIYAKCKRSWYRPREPGILRDTTYLPLVLMSLIDWGGGGCYWQRQLGIIYFKTTNKGITFSSHQTLNPTFSLLLGICKLKYTNHSCKLYYPPTEKENPGQNVYLDILSPLASLTKSATRS